MEPTQMPESSAPVAPVTESAPVKKSSLGTIIALVIVVLALVGGAIFFLKERVGTDADDATVSALQEQGTSTDPSAIEADLSAQSPDTFDQDLDSAFTELDASLNTQ